MSAQPKAMPLFFIDNQATWPVGAELVGDLVVWPDHGKYPSYVPIATAKSPFHKGTIVVQAGNRGLVVSFLDSTNEVGIRREMSAFNANAEEERTNPKQYRIAVDAIMHRLTLMRANKDAGLYENSVHPFSLLSWLAKAHPKEAMVLVHALKANLSTVGNLECADRTIDAKEVFEMSEDMISTMEKTLGGTVGEKA